MRERGTDRERERERERLQDTPFLAGIDYVTSPQQHFPWHGGTHTHTHTRAHTHARAHTHTHTHTHRTTNRSSRVLTQRSSQLVC